LFTDRPSYLAEKQTVSLYEKETVTEEYNDQHSVDGLDIRRVTEQVVTDAVEIYTFSDQLVINDQVVTDISQYAPDQDKKPRERGIEVGGKRYTIEKMPTEDDKESLRPDFEVKEVPYPDVVIEENNTISSLLAGQIPDGESDQLIFGSGITKGWEDPDHIAINAHIPIS
jgi:hypothetical protein